MPTTGPVLGEALTGMLAGRGLTLHPECCVERIDPASRGDDAGRRGCCLRNPLLGVPPHHAGEFLRGSGLAVDTGFPAVTVASLATTAEGVFAVGDGQAAFASGDFRRRTTPRRSGYAGPGGTGTSPRSS